MPDLFVITGPNGAGKSSNANSLIPKPNDFPIFDGDKLFYQLLDKHYKEIKVPKYAREKAEHDLQDIFEHQVNSAIIENQDFAYEGHFSSEHSWSTIKQFRLAGYKINMVFLALDDVNVSLQRVAVRVSQGGHHVAPAHIYENYFGNIKSLDRNLALIDRLLIIDNSSTNAIHILTLEDRVISSLTKKHLPAWLKSNMPQLMQIIERSESYR
ncbi:zeta toxin family protein [Dyadobacter sp. CY326]|uniref:zeta toxin family protein n=1 Tax=Dyadobacter sp. CY326 TaxID=2907300 RepID=UPI001F01936D|nr:zeta toxin family protein [Dyadobacter sp. CY326]MCE7063979.1 zeta toxin family protein [Dyadobacter sp. CY326]